MKKVNKEELNAIRLAFNEEIKSVKNGHRAAYQQTAISHRHDASGVSQTVEYK